MRSLFFSDSGVFALMRQNPLRDNDMSDQAAGCLHTSRMITHNVKHSDKSAYLIKGFLRFLFNRNTGIEGTDVICSKNR